MIDHQSLGVTLSWSEFIADATATNRLSEIVLAKIIFRRFDLCFFQDPFLYGKENAIVREQDMFRAQRGHSTAYITHRFGNIETLLYGKFEQNGFDCSFLSPFGFIDWVKESYFVRSMKWAKLEWNHH